MSSLPLGSNADYRPLSSLHDDYDGGSDPFDERPLVGVDIKSLEAEIAINRIDEIRKTMSKLTYGEMIELASGIWDEIARPDELTQSTLAAVLHKWTTR